MASATRRKTRRARTSGSRGRPFVAATFAMTADGKITTRDYAPIDFTSRADKARLIEQRARADAVLIGYGTLKKDNVRLGIPRVELREQRIALGQQAYPMRVMVSNTGRIDPALNIFHSDFGPIVIFSTTRMPRRLQKVLREKATVHLSEADSVDLEWLLQQLQRDYKVRTVECEGGAQLFSALLQRGLVDQLNLTIAPWLFGGKNAPTLTGTMSGFLPKSVRCTLRDMKMVGDECFLTYRISPSKTREGIPAACEARKAFMKSSTKDRIKGRAAELKGKVNEKVGRATGNPNREDRGTMEKVGGKVQRKVGEVKKVFGK